MQRVGIASPVENRSVKAGADLLSLILIREFSRIYLSYSYASIPQVGRYANET